MDLLLQPLPENASVAKYRHITEYVRTLIANGELKPGTRLPPIKELAKRWNTNYFTVRLALTPLANEGLIERSPGRGSFVRDRQSHLTSVAIYYGGNLWTDPEGSFYQKLYYVLQSLLEKKNVRITTFIDTRPAPSQITPLPELVKAIERREVQGIIGPMLSPAEVDWLETLNVPLSVFGRRGITGDYTEMVGLALDRLAADGCKTVGTVSSNVGQYEVFEQAAAARELTTTPHWCHFQSPTTSANSETIGYRGFKDIWAQQMRPDGIFIQYDWVCRGAITAILELGVRVPQNLRLVLYKNEGVEYLCPWAIPFVVQDTAKVAELLVEFVEKQHQSGKLNLKASIIPLQMVG
jgi:DNA-binding LacI/PurR family transcriptional regulator